MAGNLDPAPRHVQDRRSEAAEPVRRTEPGGTVVSGNPRAKVDATAVPVGAADDVEQTGTRPVWTDSVAHAGGVPRHRVDARDDGRAEARATDDEPPAEAERVVYGQPGVRIGDRCDVRDAPLVAEPILLPSGLVDVRRAAARRASPRSLGPAPLVAVRDERGAANRGHELGRARIAHAPGQDEPVPVTVVARRDGDRHAAVVVVALEILLAREFAAAAV